MGLNPPTLIDLFCGAGGLSLGLGCAGFRLVSALDCSAAETYARNIGKHVSEAYIQEDTVLPPAAVIAGGPPCQGFSSAGRRHAGDDRNSLIAVFSSLVARHRPAAFVFENVEGFLTAEDGRRVFDLLCPLIDAGYRIHVRKINAANYGVPQHRKRVIAIGGLGWEPSFPPPSHTAFGAPGAAARVMGLPKCPTLADALRGLPPASSEPPGEPTDHYFAPLRPIDLERAAALRPGQTMKDLPPELRHDSYGRRAYRRVMDGTPTERRGGAPAGLRRLRPDEPSKAITGGAVGEFLHPYDHRMLTPRECARIQTFPDDFVFVGRASDRVQLIGNAVPPLLGEVIGRHLLRELASAQPCTGGGALLSFEATAASGMSPALERTCTLVRESLPWHPNAPRQFALLD